MTVQNGAPRANPHPRPKCGHAPGHSPGDCTPTLDSWAAKHLDAWLPDDSNPPGQSEGVA